MKPKYMLDTNICIYLMKHQPVEVKARFDQCFVGEVVISAITLAELEYGVTCSGIGAASNRARSRDALDKLIAAHAIALGVTPVTNNAADFAVYPGLARLRGRTLCVHRTYCIKQPNLTAVRSRLGALRARGIQAPFS